MARSTWVEKCHLMAENLLGMSKCSGGFRGGSGGSLEPPLGPNYFNFMGKFSKNQV